jgi:hypothetical protein
MAERSDSGHVPKESQASDFWLLQAQVRSRTPKMRCCGLEPQWRLASACAHEVRLIQKILGNHKIAHDRDCGMGSSVDRSDAANRGTVSSKYRSPRSRWRQPQRESTPRLQRELHNETTTTTSSFHAQLRHRTRGAPQQGRRSPNVQTPFTFTPSDIAEMSSVMMRVRRDDSPREERRAIAYP